MPSDLVGLGWLKAAIAEARGLVEFEQDARGGITPKIYLPGISPATDLPERPLDGRRIWVVDRDELLRDTLASLIRQWGGEAMGFEDLASLLRESRDAAAPDVMILERTSRLERYQNMLSRFQREPIPTLVLGEGQALPLNPATLGLKRLGFLEKPMSADELAHALLALLRPLD